MSLPEGFRVRLAPGAIRTDDGRVLVGGSPLTALRLSPRAHALLRKGRLTVTDAASGRLADRLLATNLGLPDLDGTPSAPSSQLMVVIPVRDRPAQLARTLEALAPLRCVVVDDHSARPEDTVALAERHGAEVVLLQSNLGPAAARNAGLALVTTPYVAFVDSDVEVTGADLLRLTRHFADPAVALVGPRVQGHSRSAHPRWFERYDIVASSLTLGTTAATVRPGAAVAWLPSACLVGRTAALAGGFSADMRVGEDVDLVWRLIADGWRVRYDPDVTAQHDTRTTLRDWLARKAFYGSGGADLAARHGNNLAPAILTPTYALAAAAILCRRPWSVPIAVLALAQGTARIRSAIPEAPGRDRIATRVAARGLWWALRQESALALRHWWPASAALAGISPHARRALVSALIVDTVAAMRESDAEALSIAALVAGRRLDDAAYGSGLWIGAARGRSLKVLLPRRPLHGTQASSRKALTTG